MEKITINRHVSYRHVTGQLTFRVSVHGKSSQSRCAVVKQWLTATWVNILLSFDTYVHAVLYAKTHRHTPFRVGERFSQAACHDAKNQSNACKTHCKIHLLTLNVSSFFLGCSLHALHVPAVRHGLSFFEFIIVRVCGLIHVYPNGHTHIYIYIYIYTHKYTCIYIYIPTYRRCVYRYVSVCQNM